MNQAVAIHKGAPVSRFGPDQIDLIKRTVCKGATDDELKLFMYQAERTGLDPLARQIHAVKRWDSQQNREVMSIQVSIDGFRLIAERTGKYAGQLGPFWCGEDGDWSDVWLSDKHPTAARVGVLRTDFKEPCWGVARFNSYAQKKKDGTPTRMWATMGDVMVAKCAEALALRKAFPQDLSGLYTGDEMEQASAPVETKDVTPPKETPVKPQVVAAPTHDPETGEVGPHEIKTPAKGTGMSPYIAWGQLFLAAIGEAKSDLEIAAWIEANKAKLKEISVSVPKVSERIDANVTAARAKFADIPKSLDRRKKKAVPAPEQPDEFLAYVETTLAACQTLDELETAWNDDLAPVVGDAFPPDAAIADASFEKHKARLSK